MVVAHPRVLTRTIHIASRVAILSSSYKFDVIQRSDAAQNIVRPGGKHPNEAALRTIFTSQLGS